MENTQPIRSFEDYLDRYFRRKEAITKALTNSCPICLAEPFQKCIDRWGIFTSSVHQARYTDSYNDPYGME